MSDRFHVQSLPLPGLMLLERRPLRDERGFLERLFCRDTFYRFGLDADIQQMNRTLTRQQGAVRGMHYQMPPHAEIKIVTCLQGEVFDVAVDLRAGSPTFLQWHGENLSQDNGKMLVIPKGFAHGFQTLTNDCEMLYFHSVNHAPMAERGIPATDPIISISWPLEITQMSTRDQEHPPIHPQFQGIEVPLEG